MFQYKYQRVFIAVAALVILAIGVVFGNYLSSRLSPGNFQSINIGLAYTNIVVVLITFSLVVEIRKILEQSKKR